MICNLLTPTFEAILSIMQYLFDNIQLLCFIISDILPETIHEKRTKHKMLLSMMMKKYSMKVSCLNNLSVSS